MFFPGISMSPSSSCKTIPPLETFPFFSASLRFFTLFPLLFLSRIEGRGKGEVSAALCRGFSTGGDGGVTPKVEKPTFFTGAIFCAINCSVEHTLCFLILFSFLKSGESLFFDWNVGCRRLSAFLPPPGAFLGREAAAAEWTRLLGKEGGGQRGLFPSPKKKIFLSPDCTNLGSNCSIHTVNLFLPLTSAD